MAGIENTSEIWWNRMEINEDDGEEWLMKPKSKLKYVQFNEYNLEEYFEWKDNEIVGEKRRRRWRRWRWWRKRRGLFLKRERI